MSLDKLNVSLAHDVAALEREGRAKAPERVLDGYVPASGARGPRYRSGCQTDALLGNSRFRLDGLQGESESFCEAMEMIEASVLVVALGSVSAALDVLDAVAD